MNTYLWITGCFYIIITALVFVWYFSTGSKTIESIPNPLIETTWLLIWPLWLPFILAITLFLAWWSRKHIE